MKKTKRKVGFPYKVKRDCTKCAWEGMLCVKGECYYRPKTTLRAKPKPVMDMQARCDSCVNLNNDRSCREKRTTQIMENDTINWMPACSLYIGHESKPKPTERAVRDSLILSARKCFTATTGLKVTPSIDIALRAIIVTAQADS